VGASDYIRSLEVRFTQAPNCDVSNLVELWDDACLDSIMCHLTIRVK